MSEKPGITDVAIALVRRGDCFLVGVRESGRALAGHDEFPGGKCGPGESPEDCAVRECREETGVPVRVLRLRRLAEHQYPHGRVRLHFFDCEPLADFQPIPPFRWLPREQLPRLRFPDANATLVEELMRE